MPSISWPLWGGISFSSTCAGRTPLPLTQAPKLVSGRCRLRTGLVFSPRTCHLNSVPISLLQIGSPLIICLEPGPPKQGKKEKKKKISETFLAVTGQKSCWRPTLTFPHLRGADPGSGPAQASKPISTLERSGRISSRGGR